MASLNERATRDAPFAVRAVQRASGIAAIIYRRRVNDRMEERFDRVAALSPLAFTAAGGVGASGSEGGRWALSVFSRGHTRLWMQTGARVSRASRLSRGVCAIRDAYRSLRSIFAQRTRRRQPLGSAACRTAAACGGCVRCALSLKPSNKIGKRDDAG